MSVQKIGPMNKIQHSFDAGDESICGFLNRKHDIDCSRKRAKDRAWALIWCCLKKNILEIYKVDGINKQPDEPPPKDQYPLPHLHKQKIGFVDVLNAQIEVDFTSQMNKDLQKRRKALFRLILANGTEDIYQSSNELHRSHWVSALKKAAVPHSGEDENEGAHSISHDSRLKIARCSINKRSRQHVDSFSNLQAGPLMLMESPNTEISMPDLQLRLQALKSILHKKKELLKQLNRMNLSFNGDISSMYSESAQAVGLSKWTQAAPVLDEDRRFSLPSIPIMVGSEDSDSDKRSSTGEGSGVSFIHHSSSHYNYDCRAVETTLLSDYYLIPGAEWSLLRANETVHVIGLLPNGWYRCVVPRDTFLTPSSSVSIAHERGDSTGDASAFLDISELPDVTKDGPGPEEDFLMEHGFSEGTGTVAKDTGEHEQSQNGYDKGEEKTTPTHSTEDLLLRNAIRNSSYRIATRQYHSDSASSSDRDSIIRSSWLPRHSITSMYSTSEGSTSQGAGLLPTDQHIEGDDPLAMLIAAEQAREPPCLPLVGCLPPCVLAKFAHKARAHMPALPVRPSRVPSPIPPEYPSAAEDAPPLYSSVVTPNATSSDLSVDDITIAVTFPLDAGSESRVTCSTPEPSLVPSLSMDTLITSSISMDSISTPRATTPGVEPTTPGVEPTTPGVEPTTLGVEPTTPGVEPTTPGLIVGCPVPQASRRSELLSDSTQEVLLRPGRVAIERRRSSNEGAARSPTRQGRGVTPQGGGAGASLSSSLDSKPAGFFKKLFTKKDKSLPVPVGDRASRRSSSPSAVGEEMRPRLASQSGQAVTVVGGAVLIGNSDSSDDEDGEEERSPKDGQLKRSSSDHSNLKDRVQAEVPPGREKPLMARRRSLKESPLATTHKTPNRNDSYVFDTLDSTKINSIFRTPPRGQRRKIVLDRKEPKYGFKLETYIRHTEHGKVEQTFVQSVNPGSPAFLAGLFAGDMIEEVDGVDVSHCSVEGVVKVFKGDKAAEAKIQMVAVFVDGVSRLEVKKKADGLKKELRQRQQRLKGLVEKEKALPSVALAAPSTGSLPTSVERSCPGTLIDAPLPVASSQGWQMWEETVAIKSKGPTSYHYNSRLNKAVVLHVKEATTLACDVMVMPSSSCWNSSGSSPQDNILFQYLKQGGRGLLDELSLVKQGRPGEVMSTGGHGLPVQRIFHCLMGSNDDSAQLCVAEALRQARSGGHLTVAFWVDGFAHVQVPPSTIVEAVRQWLAEDGNGYYFHHVIFTCANSVAITQTQLELCFPHMQFDPPDALGESDQSDDGDNSPKMNQEVLVASEPLVPSAGRKELQPSVFQFDIMPGALQSDV